MVSLSKKNEQWLYLLPCSPVKKNRETHALGPLPGSNLSGSGLVTYFSYLQVAKKRKTMLTLDLVIRKENGGYTGSLTYKDNPITQSAPSIPELETQIKKLLWEFESLGPETVEFEHYFQCPAFFDAFQVLDMDQLAVLTTIDAGKLRAFASGTQKPVPEEAEKIEKALKALASRLMKASLVLS